jgi:hypothetical protein
MSESFYIPIVYGVILAIFALNSDDRKNNAEQYLVIFGTIFLGLMIGLTEAPFLFIFGVFFWIDFISKSIKSKKWMIDRKSFWTFSQPVAFILMLSYVAIICYYFSNVNLKQFFYWNITFNSSFIQASIFDNLAYILRNLFDKSLYPLSNLLLSQVSIYFLAIIFAFTSAALVKLNGSLLKKSSLLLLFIFLYLSFFWRTTFGYKIFPSIGFLMAMMVCLVGSRLPRFHLNVRSADVYLQRFGNFSYPIVALCIFSVLQWSQIGLNPFWSEVGICSLNAPLTVNCRCLTSDVWGPQFFIEQDVRPCPGLFPALPPPFFEVSTTREIFSQYLKSGEIALNKHNSDMTPWVTGELKSIYSDLTCFEFSPLSKICYQKK